MSTTATKPTILIVPGSFCNASHYTSVLTALHALSYPAQATSLPSATRVPPAPGASLAEDAAHIAALLTSLADDGQDIVLLAHSYGGIPATEAARGLAKAERAAQGKPGGIVKIVYLSAIVPPVGG